DSDTFWLSETPDKPSKSWDAALPRICTWGKFISADSGNEVYVFNTHFDHVGREARKHALNMITQKIEELASFNSAILLGDFNLEPDTEPINTLVDTPMDDTFDKAKARFGSFGTFNGFDYAKIPNRRIDYVFVSPDFAVLSYSTASHIIDGRYLSDHFPVIVTLQSK
ncbi:MAG: endonuclease/exonuclease/phosphatase family protein, partial [Bacteroidota bacterium]